MRCSRGAWMCGVLGAISFTVVSCSPQDRSGGFDSFDSESVRARAAELQGDVERLSGLPAREPLKLGVRSQESLEVYLKQELEEQFAGDRIRNLVRVYARLGLVPESLDLEPLLSRLLLEQVVGFYDPASDTLFVVEGVSADQADAVLVHEMVHALQDQYTDLDSLMTATRDSNDAGMAFQAAIEGHATFVMVEWMMERQLGTAVDLTQAPPLGETLGDNPFSAGAEMPELAQAPSVIREQLLFPYVAGLEFLQVFWGGPAGRTPPIGASMPATTEQILHPGQFGTENVRSPAPLRFDRPPPDNWTEVFQGGLGEFDIRLILREFLPSRDIADQAAAGWDGDMYRLLDGQEGESLVWISRWDTPNDAREFAVAAERAFGVRYQGEPGRKVSVRRIGELTVLVQDVPSELHAGLPSSAASYVEE